MRRFLSRVSLVAVLLTVLGLYPLLSPPPHRIDAAHFEMIKGGMTREQVEAIFGVPAGEYDWAQADSDALWLDLMGVRSGTVTSRQVIDWDLDLFTPQRERFVVNEIIVDSSMTSLGLSHFNINAGCIWTSRHGSYSIWFDHQGRVSTTGTGGEVKIVP